MKIVSSESLRVATLGGTAVLFEAGVPREIAEEIGLLAIQMGAKEYNDKYVEEEEAEIAEVIEIVAPEVSVQLNTTLVTVLEKLMDEGDPKNFKTNGHPKAAVVNKAMGETIGTDEREAAWESILNSQVYIMAVTVQSVIDRAQTVLQDTTGVRWPVVSELVLWINDAQREIALLKPDASATNTTITLVTGTKQDIPSGGNRLLKAVRNMSAASNGTGKRSVRLVDREVLDGQTPDWHDPTVSGDAAHTNIVKHYIYDEANPRNFYVYPGVSGNAYLEIIYSSNPAAVTQSGSLSIPDIYANAIMNYVLYMAYMKDAEYAGNAQRASSHFQLFTTSVTGKGQIDAMTNPNMERRAQLTAV